MGIRVQRTLRRRRAVAGGVGLLTLIVVLSGCPNPVITEEGDQVPEPEPPAEAVTFSPDPDEYDTDTSVELTTATPGATIYYTQDGTEPDAGATEYTRPIALVGHATETTITAIAVANGYEPSEPSAATYTIDYLSGLNYREMTSVPAGDFFQEEPLDADEGVYIDGFS
ncbi:MAG: chitobiase/beta-hexosaminidase C-terminal domain-containing protein, partial [Spirochaetota bacterium]